MGRARRSGPKPTGRARPPARHVVVSIGGSVLFTGEDDARYQSQIVNLVRRTAPELPLVLTTGGGRTAREYIEIGRALGLSDYQLDELGIEVTRLHARLLAIQIGPPASPDPPTTVPDAVEAARHTTVLVLGGTEPGHTTDAVAALVAAGVGAERVVNATRVAGLFDRDPRTDPTARPIRAIDWPRFLERVRAATRGRPGEEFVFDRVGAEALSKAGIPLVIVDGRDVANLELAIRGRRCEGTVVGGPGRTDLSAAGSAAP